jgi:predicted nucleic acid-binding protein
VPLLFWDASALAKRFGRERGSDTVDALLDQALTPDQSTTAWGYAEAYSVLLRKHNDGRIDFPSFLAAVAALQAEVVDSGRFHFLPLDDATIFASPLMMGRHNLNATDAAILTMLLDVVPNLTPGDALVLIAADTRLLRAGTAEGLVTLNPETVAAADVPALLAAL